MLVSPDFTRRLRATGWARYFDAVFLCLWLAIWVVGEVVALALIGAVLASALAAARHTRAGRLKSVSTGPTSSLESRCRSREADLSAGERPSALESFQTSDRFNEHVNGRSRAA